MSKSRVKPPDISLETEIYFLRKENARLYQSIILATQPPPMLERCTCHYTNERVADPKCPRHNPISTKQSEPLKTSGD